MKWQLNFEGDYYEDAVHLKQLTNSWDAFMALSDIRQKIRDRLKYHEVSDQEEKFLTELHEIAYEFEHD